MKKMLNILIITAIALLGFSRFDHHVLAEDTKEPLISDLVYDKENHVLTGKTVPNANVSLADIVATITADEEGHFSIPIPDDLEKTTITIMDFLNDQSTDVNYNFVAQTIDTTEEHVVSQSTTIPSSQSSSTQTQAVANKQEPDNPSQKESSVVIWVVVLVIIVILTILGIFLVNKQKAEKQQAELIQSKKTRSGRRKRRKKSAK